MSPRVNLQHNTGRRGGAHILRFHTDVLTELLHGVRADYLVGAGVRLEPRQALLVGEELLSGDRPRASHLRSGETATHTHQIFVFINPTAFFFLNKRMTSKMLNDDE